LLLTRYHSVVTDSIEAIADRPRTERETRGWTIAGLANKSGHAPVLSSDSYTVSGLREAGIALLLPPGQCALANVFPGSRARLPRLHRETVRLQCPCTTQLVTLTTRRSHTGFATSPASSASNSRFREFPRGGRGSNQESLRYSANGPHLGAKFAPRGTPAASFDEKPRPVGPSTIIAPYY